MLRALSSAFLFSLLIVGHPYWVLFRREFGTRFLHALVLANIVLLAGFYALHTSYAQAHFPAVYLNVSHGMMVNVLGMCTGLCLAHLFRHHIIPMMRFNTTPGERDPWSIGRPTFGTTNPALTNGALLAVCLYLVWNLTLIDVPPNQLAWINLACVIAYVLGLMLAAVGSRTLTVFRE